MPLSEGAVDAEQGGDKPGENNFCLNCGLELTGKFCSQCGQKDIPKRQTLGELIENFIGSFFSFESKFFRTIRYLLFRPGFLAVEYNSGRREKYYHPARMYVFTSFLYFLLFFSLPDNEPRNDEIQDEKKITSDSTKKSDEDFKFSLTTDEYETREQYDSIQATLPEAKRDGWLMKKMQYRSLFLKQQYKKDGKKFSEDFGDSFAANTPKVIFLLLPIFALILKLLYVRRDYYYSEHLVLSIYFYNFLFVAGVLTLLLEQIPGLDRLSELVILIVFFYLAWALKVVYKQGWGKTISKFLILTFTFSICFLLGLFINLAITLVFF